MGNKRREKFRGQKVPHNRAHDARSKAGNREDTHHFHPKSRCRSKKSKRRGFNTVRLKRRVHEDWHALFSNMVPIEVIYHLVTEWPDSRTEFRVVHLVSVFEGRRSVFTLGKEPVTYGTYSWKPKKNKASFQNVFGRRANLFDAVVQVIESWSPNLEGYWQEIHLEAMVGEHLLKYHKVFEVSQ